MNTLLFLLKGWLHRCQRGGCFAEAYPCYLSDNMSDVPDYWYCWEHMSGQGFCRFCGMFWGGIDEFDFGTGYCPNCTDQLNADGSDFDDDERCVVYAEDAPKTYQNLSEHGGDEDLVAKCQGNREGQPTTGLTNHRGYAILSTSRANTVSHTGDLFY